MFSLRRLVLTLTTQGRTPFLNGQVTAGTLVCAILKIPMGDWLMKRRAEPGPRLAEVTVRLRTPGMKPQDAHEFEHCVEVLVRARARSFQQMALQCTRTPESGSDAAASGTFRAEVSTTQNQDRPRQRTHAIRKHHLDESHFSEGKPWTDNCTSGNHTRHSAWCDSRRSGSCGALGGRSGIVAESQQRGDCRTHKCQVGLEKLRHRSSYLAKIMVPQRQACQMQ